MNLGHKPVKRTGKSEEGGRVGKVRVGEGGSDKMRGVGRRVPSLVVTVQGNIQSQVFGQGLVLAKPEHVGVVACACAGISSPTQITEKLATYQRDQGPC